MSTLPTIQKSLLDDLRNATEFYKSAQGVQGEIQAAAREWIESAALNLGQALIEAHAARDTQLTPVSTYLPEGFLARAKRLQAMRVGHQEKPSPRENLRPPVGSQPGTGAGNSNVHPACLAPTKQEPAH